MVQPSVALGLRPEADLPCPLTGFGPDKTTTQHVVVGSRNIILQGGHNSTFTFTSPYTGEDDNERQDGIARLESKIDEILTIFESKIALLESKIAKILATSVPNDSTSCHCNGTCNCKEQQLPTRIPAVMPYCGSSHSKSIQRNKTFECLFRLRHHGRFKDFSRTVDILQGMSGFDPNMQALISLSKTYSACINGESSSALTKISSNTDDLIRRTDSPIEFGAHRIYATVLMNVADGKFVLGLTNSYSAIQEVYHIRPGYLKGMVLSSRVYVLSRLIPNEKCPEARRLLMQEGIRCCRLAIENADQEEHLKHLMTACTNLKGQAFLFMAMLYLECSLSADTTARRRTICPENLEGAKKAMEEVMRLDYAPFTEIRYNLLKSDFKFREGQLKGCPDYYRQALEAAKYTKILAQHYSLQAEVKYADYRITFLEDEQSYQGMP